MGNPFEDLRQAVVVRPMNSPGPQGAEAPEIKIQYSNDGLSWHNDPIETDRYLCFSTDNGVSWSNAIYFNNLAETLEWVEKARKWAENPENDPVEDLQYSALHHALQAKKSEITAGEYAIDAAGSATEAFGAAAPAWDGETVYNYNDVVSFDNGHTYRCIGTDIIGEDHAPNINGVDNVEEWTRITVALDGYFEIDENGDLIPMLVPITSEIFMLDENGDITYQEDIDLEPGGAIELYGKTEFVDSIADLRSSSFYGTTEYVYVAGYYGAGTPGGGVFYKDIESSEPDNGGTIIVDSDNIRWKRANVHEEYYASWFGVSIDIDDNSPLIQNALNVIPSGNVLIFGPGRYECKQTITMPDHPIQTSYSMVKNISLKGYGTTVTRSNPPSSQVSLVYTGPSRPTLTPLFDFRGSTGDKWYHGSIQNIAFYGGDPSNNIVCLAFHHCARSLFENLYIERMQCGIKIYGHYYYSVFNKISCYYCNHGFETVSMANKAVFNYCSFSGNDIGFIGNTSGDYDHGVQFNDCYFEHNRISIDYTLMGSLCIHQCYFEHNSECEIYIHDTRSKSLLTLEKSFILNTFSAMRNSIIKQDTPSDRTVLYAINNNYIYNSPSEYSGNFINVINGSLTIEARNNFIIGTPFQICSTTPSDTSYFNNDFS